MKYIEIYNKMIDIFQNTPGIRSNLCKYYDVKNAGETVKEIIEKNSVFKNSADTIKDFVKKFYEFGGITKESFEEFQYFVNGNLKSINRVVFAAVDKIDTTLDVTYNEITIIEDINKYLIYKNESYGTITWANLVDCFSDKYPNKLYDRILMFSSDIEKRFYNAYTNYISDSYSDKNRFNEGKYPNLLPQFALKNRVKTIKQDGGLRKVIHRIDFGMVLNGRVILIEIDGLEHYSFWNNYCNEINLSIISNERCLDRELILDGYEIYRFLNVDIQNRNDEELKKYLKEFFEKLFKKHNIRL